MSVLIIFELLAIDPQSRLAAITMTPSVRFAWLESSAMCTEASVISSDSKLESGQ